MSSSKSRMWKWNLTECGIAVPPSGGVGVLATWCGGQNVNVLTVARTWESVGERRADCW